MRLPVRRRTAASWVAATSVVALAVAGVTSTGSTASAADPDEVIQGLSAVAQPGQRSTTRSTPTRRSSSALATDLAGSAEDHESQADPRDDQVRLRRGRELPRDGLRVRRDQPERHRPASSTTDSAVKQSALPALREGRRSAPSPAGVEAAVPAATVTASYRVVYGGVAATVPGNSIRKILQIPGVVAVQRDAVQPPADRLQPGVHQRHGGLQHAARPRGTPARASCSATSTPASGPSTRPSPTRATCRRTPARRSPVQLRRQPADAGGRPVRVQQEAGRRPRTSSTTYDAEQRRPTCTPTPRVTPRATARTPRPRRPATSVDNVADARRRSSPGSTASPRAR